MKVLHDNVLVTEHKKDSTTSAGIILQSDLATGHKPAAIIAFGEKVSGLAAGNIVYLDWTKALPVELDGLKCAVVKFEDIKLVTEE